MMAARSPVELVIGALESHGKRVTRRGNGCEAQCPAHEDRNPSLSVSEGDDGRALVNCHGGCPADEVVRALGLTTADLFPPKPKTGTGPGEIVDRYVYEDENGDPVFRVLRYESKQFRQQRYDNGTWKWKVSDLPDHRRYLPFRLPNVLKAIANGDTIYIAEGEKDVLALERAGVTATCNAGGAGKWRYEHRDWLKGVTDVVIVADNDDVGIRHAHEVAMTVVELSVPPDRIVTIRIVKAAEGKDASDHLAAGHTVDEFVKVERTELAAAINAGKPDEPDDEESVPLDGFPSEWNDAEVGEAFADHIRGRYLWVKAWGWMRWDGRRWDNDRNESVFEEARQWIIALGIRAMKMPGNNGPVVKAIVNYKRKGAFDAIVTVARRQHGIAASVDEFDQHPDLLNVRNGVVDLTNGELRPHDPDLRLTKLAGAAYDPTASHPDVEAALGLVEPEVKDWIVRLFGYAATGHVNEDVVPVFDGAGSNGKTSIVVSVRAALGEYATVAPDRLILKTAHEEHSTLLADLHGRRLVAIEETPEGGSLRVERIKSLSGGNTLKARFIGKDYFEFEPTHTLVIATNHRPKVNNTEHAIWRRLRLVPFPYTLVDEDKAGPGDRVIDTWLRERLKRKAQREAMLTWIVAGAVAWHEHGLGSCPAIDQATEAWRLEEDVIARFLADQIVPDPEGFISGGDLFAAYKRWCEDENRPAKSNKNFTGDFFDHEWVKGMHILKTKVQGSFRYRGIRQRGLADPDDPWLER